MIRSAAQEKTASRFQFVKGNDIWVRVRRELTACVQSQEGKERDDDAVVTRGLLTDDFPGAAAGVAYVDTTAEAGGRRRSQQRSRRRETRRDRALQRAWSLVAETSPRIVEGAVAFLDRVAWAQAAIEDRATRGLGVDRERCDDDDDEEHTPPHGERQFSTHTVAAFPFHRSQTNHDRERVPSCYLAGSS